MKRNYKILNIKNCKGTNFRIVKDLNSIGGWHIIQYEIRYKRKYKKLWKFREYQDALDEFDCENLLERIIWKENL